jgi:hypothetical protein
MRSIGALAVGDIPSLFRAESAKAINNQAYNKNQANSSSAEDGPSKIKATPAE